MNKQIKNEREELMKAFYIQWHITETCNLNCLHCYQNKEIIKNEMNDQEFIETAKKLEFTLKKLDKKGRVAVTGGEPLIKKRRLYKLLQFLKESPVFIESVILTNGTMITERIAKELKELNVREIQVSLDGSCPEIHDRIRGKGNFEKAIRGIRLLKKAGIKVAIMFVVHKMNKNDVNNMVNLADELKVNRLSITRLVPTGVGKGLDQLLLKSQEVRNLFENLYKKSKQLVKHNSKLIIAKSRPLWCLINPEIAGKMLENPGLEVGGTCPAGINSLTLLPNGDVMPCRRMNIKIGNIREDSFFKIWYDSDVLWGLRNKSLKSGCKRCKYINICGGCSAISYAVTGDYLAKDPQCWYEQNA